MKIRIEFHDIYAGYTEIEIPQMTLEEAEDYLRSHPENWWIQIEVNDMELLTYEIIEISPVDESEFS